MSGWSVENEQAGQIHASANTVRCKAMDREQLLGTMDVQTLRTLLVEKLQIIADHERSITDRDQQIIEHVAVITDREQVIARHERAITKHDANIAKLTAEIARLRRAQLAALGKDRSGAACAVR
ncbi:MAG: hypothetical protein ABI304_11535 [Rudaea sp.]